MLFLWLISFLQGSCYYCLAFHVGELQHLKTKIISTTRWATTTTAMPEVMAPSQKKSSIPITLLSGFLGAGKTTTLKHLLENKEDLKIGVIVNDIASVNIDRKLVVSSNNDSNEKGDELIELQNGCVCCTLSDELVASVERLVGDDATKTGGKQQHELDAIVVELSGVANPGVIEAGWQLTERATIDRIVTLVDANSFGSDYMTMDSASDRPGWSVNTDDGCADHVTISQLLADQVESANLIILNKVDLAGDSQVKVASKVIGALNDKAQVKEAEYGQVSAKLVLGLEDEANENKCEEEPTTSSCCSNSNCSSNKDNKSDDNSDKKKMTTTEDLGFYNFVYEATRPFHNERLMTALEQQWPTQQDLETTLQDKDGSSSFSGIVRSKGFCWIAPTQWTGDDNDAWYHNNIVYWSVAGRQFELSASGQWWAAMERKEMEDFFREMPNEVERIRREDFKTEEFGDRRQEIVMIGTKNVMKQDAITEAFNSCLLSDEEMEDYRNKLELYGNSITEPSLTHDHNHHHENN